MNPVGIGGPLGQLELVIANQECTGSRRTPARRSRCPIVAGGVRSSPLRTRPERRHSLYRASPRCIVGRRVERLLARLHNGAAPPFVRQCPLPFGYTVGRPTSRSNI